MDEIYIQKNWLAQSQYIIFASHTLMYFNEIWINESWYNQVWSKTYICLKEILDTATEATVASQEHIVQTLMAYISNTFPL